MADVKWIKLTTDMFDNSKIKQIRSLPDGNNIILIWVMLLVYAGKCNCNGMICISESIPMTEQMIATELGFPIKTVELALEALAFYKMVHMYDGCFVISNWEEYQSGDRLEEMREKHRKRQERYRNNQKLKIEEKRDVTRDVTVDATSSISISNNNNSYSLYIREIIDYLNISIGSKYTYKNKTNNSHITARLDEGFTVDDFKTVIDKKSKQWGSDPKMSQYLRPSTLFSKSHFEEYLNQQEVSQKGSVEATYDVVKDWLSGE